jgi:hypothetical protein
MWKANQKTTTLVLFLDSLSQSLSLSLSLQSRCNGKQLLEDVKEEIRYWKLMEEAQERTPWRTHFGRSYGPAARHYYYC